MPKRPDPKLLEQEFLTLIDNIAKSTQVDTAETPAQKRERIKRLEADDNQEEWIKYYFPDYSFCPPATFHTASTSRIVAAYKEMKIKGSGKFYQSRVWARGLSKSTRRMMEVFYLHYAMKMPINGLLLSKSQDNAIALLAPYIANFEGNQRLISDYGEQRNLGAWQAHKITTKSGFTFKAVGAGQNPRGSKKEAMRINFELFDDVDDDEVCRNPIRLDELWDWIEKAVIPCVEMSRPYFICFDNNIFAEDQAAVRAQKMANDAEVINWRMPDPVTGELKSSWPEKNTEAMLDDMIANMSYASSQAEGFNNPMSVGKTFPEITWGPCPPLKELQFVVVYADPSTSNKDKPGQKSNLTNSRKAVFIVGRKANVYYIYYGFLDVMSNNNFIASFYACRDYIAGQCSAYYLVENNTLQDPFYEQVLLKENFRYGNEHGGVLSLSGDTRKKPEKWFRIEAVLEPLNRMGRLIFNQEQKHNPHMLRLEAQFKAANPVSKQLDGPDCIEGAVFIVDQKQITGQENNVGFIPRQRSGKFY